ncbi:MAG: ComF family protein [Verrucomicrobiota bacterium]|nr:ComF family protein [Verrucomicrobiota bacterium]
MLNALSKIGRGAVSLFYPPLCAVCQQAIEADEFLCSDCQAKAPRLSPPFCRRCSEQFAGAIDGEFECANCSHRELAFESAVSAYRSRGLVRFVILQFKYSRQLQLRHPIAAWLEEAMQDARFEGLTFDALVPVPLHPAKLRERGFNQALLLAEILSEKISLPVLPALERTRYTTTQTVFDRTARMENLRGAFRLRKDASVAGQRLLLVDDVLTTGSTLSECASVLRAGGADSVHAVTAARA